MLLQHAWLAPLVKPETITEEDEEEAEAAMEAAAENAAPPTDSPRSLENVHDKEVADWVRATIEKRRQGKLGKGIPKPALHAAPLDAVSSPGTNGVNGLETAVPAETSAAA